MPLRHKVHRPKNDKENLNISPGLKISLIIQFVLLHIMASFNLKPVQKG